MQQPIFKIGDLVYNTQDTTCSNPGIITTINNSTFSTICYNTHWNQQYPKTNNHQTIFTPEFNLKPAYFKTPTYTPTHNTRINKTAKKM